MTVSQGEEPLRALGIRMRVNSREGQTAALRPRIVVGKMVDESNQRSRERGDPIAVSFDRRGGQP